ncbi:hypothetical protein D9758_014054 [Tetrapyrgos nigripes]|uniref:Glycosyltransferase 2-like domain-containing protein n=1 Tax=Tetrapyrgos nigripes TaxID=182062 RepID=A0A8H5CGZ8_9AGAR|nr:hypothetical protein D9758_014054 [Tetrapyrgos nigripes]
MSSPFPHNTLTILNNDYDAFDALLHSIYEKTQSDNWFKPLQDQDSTGVVLRTEAGSYRVFPYDTPSLLPFESAVRSLTPNPTVAVKLRNASVHAALSRLGDTDLVLEIDVNTRIQVIDELDQLRVAEKEQCQAFLRRERSLVMWSYGEDPEDIVSMWKAFEDKLIKFIWKTRGQPKRLTNTPGVFDAFAGTVQDGSAPHAQPPSLAKSISASPLRPGSSSSSPPSLAPGLPPPIIPPPPHAYLQNHPYPYYHQQSYSVASGSSYPPSAPSTAPPTPGYATTSFSIVAAQPGPFGMEEVSDREDVKRKLEFGGTAFVQSSASSSSSSTKEAKADHDADAEAAAAAAAPQNQKPKGPLGSILGWWKLDSPSPKEKGSTGQTGGDLEKSGEGRRATPERKQVLLGPFYAGLGAGLSIYFMTSGVSNLIEEWVLDGQTTRFFLCLTLPVIFCVSLFFCLQLVGNLSLIFGPVAQYHENSQYYSAIPPPPDPEIDRNLPHITIQCPVYKESLSETIAPSILSIKKAMQTYARQGGTSAIFMCDDGLRLISEKDREERLQFYSHHNIAWVSRPAHDGKPGGFKRAGKFKKASNMNYGLSVSMKLEKWLQVLVKQQEQGLPLEGDEAIKLDLENPFPEFGFHPALPSPPSGGSPEEMSEYLLSLSLEDRALLLALSESQAEAGGSPNLRPWAANGRNLRVGSIILIIDADTIVPTDCFRDAAREMLSRTDGGDSVGIIQHESDVMQVAHHYFENGITHFTRRINKCISYGCANGEVAPFVGHNAFLSWKAVQDASFVEWEDPNQKEEEAWVGFWKGRKDEDLTPSGPGKMKRVWFGLGPKRQEHVLSYEECQVLDGALAATSSGLTAENLRGLYTGLKKVMRKRGVRKVWSENNVSEDFNQALRLLLKGYNLRWATYSNGGFKEGVSLTVVDELARWQKYAYGCDEIIFNPIIHWWRKGPISAELREFMMSDAPVHYKIGMSAYMFSYYGIASACAGSVINYLLLGLASEIDRFYLHSFEILLACVVVFPAVGNLGFTLLEYRLGHRSVLGSAVENLRWVPFFVFFFGGLSIHLSTALLAHLFSYDMTWGSTGKEVEKSTFWIEVPRIIKNFKLSFIICFALIALLVIFTTNAVPVEWQIPGWQWALNIPVALVIGSHFLFPSNLICLLKFVKSFYIWTLWPNHLTVVVPWTIDAPLTAAQNKQRKPAQVRMYETVSEESASVSALDVNANGHGRGAGVVHEEGVHGAGGEEDSDRQKDSNSSPSPRHGDAMDGDGNGNWSGKANASGSIAAAQAPTTTTSLPDFFKKLEDAAPNLALSWGD